MNLTPHFTLKEMTFSHNAVRWGLDNTPPPSVIENLKRLCQTLEEVRILLGTAINISSAYRSPLVNNAAGSHSKSQHLLGCAADFNVHGMSPDEVCRAIISSGIEFDQLIREWDSWTHISVPNTASVKPRFSKLIIDAKTPNGREFV